MALVSSMPLPTKSDSYSAEDSLDAMVECLLSFENRFHWFVTVINEIEKTCGITTDDEHFWTDDDIRRAWEETQVMEIDYKRIQWAYVITFQEMKMIDNDEHETEAKTKHGILTATKDSEPESKKKSLDGRVQVIGIKIPLSELFGREATSEQTETIPSAYKLIDGCPSRREIRRKKTYVMSYNENTKNAEWVYEILNKDTLAKKKHVKRQLSDYSKVAGYTQGHLAAAGNHGWCQEAYNETFLFSNISPQSAKLNNSMMTVLEDSCRAKAKDQNCNIHIYTGPVISDPQYVNQTSSSLQKAVPHSFFKVIVQENHDGTILPPIGYLITNNSTILKDDTKDKLRKAKPMAKFVETKCRKFVEDIESISNLKFCVWDVHKVKDEIRSVTWTGEDGEGESCSAKIKVRITIPE
nr:uncharacterized protein LOC103910196 [Danio rerio]|eukprot:XP_017210189.1 uncharacterized protein LOC103910196 [Danio rerio]